MFGAGFSLEALQACLAELPPVELKGMVLLKNARHLQHHPFEQLFPTGVAREAVAEAVAEIVEYTRGCQQVTERLWALGAIPLSNFAIVEYGL